jgi:GNAT superfamily N-acetyltransferase
MEFSIRKATLDDAPALEILIAASVRRLQTADYTAEQREAAIGEVFGVDTRLILDGTYFVVEAAEQIVACGGWSRRKTLFGSDRVPGKDDAWLDPEVDAARIRAFFVHPDWARRGIGTRILRTCEDAALAMGFRRLELASTLTGIPLYRAHGYLDGEPIEVPLRTGGSLPVLRMTKVLATG